MNAIELENKLKILGYNVSNRAISNIIGITEQYYSNKKKNGTDFKQEDIEKIENKFNISLMSASVSGNKVIPVQPFDLMTSIKASCGDGIVNVDIDYMQLNNDSKYAYVFANGDSMLPSIDNGDLLIMKLQDYIDRQNDIYCFSYGEEQYIKRLSSDIDTVIASSDNNRKYKDKIIAADDMSKLRIIGRIVGLIRRF